VRGAEACAGGHDVGFLGLRRERVRRSAGEHEVVRIEHTTRCKRDAATVDSDCSIAHEATVDEQVLVGQEDAVEPLGVDERAPGGDVVHERLGGVNERYVSDVVECLGGVDAAVTPTDDNDGWACCGCCGH